MRLSNELKKEANDLPKVGSKANIQKLKNWKQISINQDIQGKALMTGNQSMAALGFGMVGEDQFPEFNELLKAVML